MNVDDLKLIRTLKFGILLLAFLGSPLGLAQGLVQEPDFEQMTQAIWLTEGGLKTKHPFGVLSVPCSSFTECRQITLNSLRNSWERYQKAKTQMPFDEFFQKRWCPVGAENDPQGLNRNWLLNFRYFMEKL